MAEALDEISLAEMVAVPSGGFDHVKESVRSRVSPRTLRV
jgi:hypothetical protein